MKEIPNNVIPLFKEAPENSNKNDLSNTDINPQEEADIRLQRIKENLKRVKELLDRLKNKAELNKDFLSNRDFKK